MYYFILLILYLVVLIHSTIFLARYRDVPYSRRLSAGLGVAGVLLAASVATFLCELLVSVFSIGLFLLIFLGGISLMLKSLFR